MVMVQTGVIAKPSTTWGYQNDAHSLHHTHSWIRDIRRRWHSGDGMERIEMSEIDKAKLDYATDPTELRFHAENPMEEDGRIHVTPELLFAVADKIDVLRADLARRDELIKRLAEVNDQLIKLYDMREYPKEKPDTMKEMCLVFNSNAEWKGLGIAEWSFAWYHVAEDKWIINTPHTHEFVTHWRYLYPTKVPSDLLTLHRALMKELE